MRPPLTMTHSLFHPGARWDREPASPFLPHPQPLSSTFSLNRLQTLLWNALAWTCRSYARQLACSALCRLSKETSEQIHLHGGTLGGESSSPIRIPERLKSAGYSQETGSQWASDRLVLPADACQLRRGRASPTGSLLRNMIQSMEGRWGN